MNTESDDDGNDKFSGIDRDEGQLGCEGWTNFQARADHETKGAADVLDGKADNGSNGKYDRHATLVLRGAVGNCTCNRWRENIADDVARGWACQGAQRGTATC